MEKSTLLLFSILLAILSSCSYIGDDKKNVTNELKIPLNGFEFQLFQRTKIEIPSESGNVFCQIDDITNGQTYLRIYTKMEVLFEKSIREGETSLFQYKGKYKIECSDLMNKLVGEDYGDFKISNISKTINSTLKIDESKQIETLLFIIENSSIIFIRNGTEYSSKEAADHLRSKWEQSGRQIKTLDEFIKNIASKSSMSGTPYQIKLKSGEIISAEEWYNEQLSNK